MARPHRIAYLSIALLCAGTLPPACANTNPWATLSGAPGGYVGAIVFDTAHPGVALAGSDGGRIFRSTDGGASWKPVQAAGAATSFYSIVVNPAVSGELLACGFHDGHEPSLFASKDDGLSWAATPAQPPNCGNIAIDATGQIIVIATGGGILYSPNGGATWQGQNVGPANTVTIDPTRPNTLWAPGITGRGQAAIWKSSDFGLHWKGLTPDAINPPNAGTEAVAMAVNPQSGKILVAWGGTLNGTFIGGIAESANGATWKASNTGLPPDFVASSTISFDPADLSHVIIGTGAFQRDPGGLYESHDGGASWKPQGQKLAAGSASLVAGRPAESGFPAALLTANPRLEISTDGGKSWTITDHGLHAGWLSSISADGLGGSGYYGLAVGDNFYGEPSSGIFHSTQTGKSWSGLNHFPKPQNASFLAVDALAAGAPIYVSDGTRVLESQNAGKSFTALSPPLPTGASVVGLFTDPYLAGHVVLLAAPNAENAVTTCVSTDGGASWASGAFGNPNDYDRSLRPPLTFAARPKGAIYAGLGLGGQNTQANLWQSTDGGLTWTVTAPPTAFLTSFLSIAAQSVKPYALMVSVRDVFDHTDFVVSRDGAATWQAVSYAPDLGTNLVASPSGPEIFAYGGASVAFSLANVDMTRDGGKTWKNISRALSGESGSDGVTVSATKSLVFLGDGDGALFSAPYDQLK